MGRKLRGWSIKRDEKAVFEIKKWDDAGYHLVNVDHPEDTTCISERAVWKNIFSSAGVNLMRVTLCYNDDAHNELVKIIFDRLAGTDTNRLPRIELDILKKIGWAACHGEVFTKGFFEMYRDIRGYYQPFSDEETDLIKAVLKSYCIEATEKLLKDVYDIGTEGMVRPT